MDGDTTLTVEAETAPDRSHPLLHILQAVAETPLLPAHKSSSIIPYLNGKTATEAEGDIYLARS